MHIDVLQATVHDVLQSEGGPSIDLDAGSQEILALLGSDPRGTRPALASAVPTSRLLTAAQTVSFCSPACCNRHKQAEAVQLHLSHMHYCGKLSNVHALHSIYQNMKLPG